MTNTDYELQPISAEEAARLRQTGGPVYVADALPGYPCRQCLQDAAIGDELLLVSYDPFHLDLPYRSASPIFIDKVACSPVSVSPIPVQITRRQLSVQAFDASALMIDAAVIDGGERDSTLRRMFGDETTTRVHVHYAVRGCWVTSVTRVGSCLSQNTYA